MRQDIPTWELKAFVSEIVSRVNQHSQSKAASSNSNPQGAMPPNLNQYQQFNQGGHGSFGGEMPPAAPVKAPLIVRPNQFHEIRSCGSREDYEMLVHTNQWIEVQRLHATALAQVLPRAAALIRKELQRKQSEDTCECCSVQ